MTRPQTAPRDYAVLGYICIITAAVLWGLQWPVSRLCQAEGVPPLEIAFWRALFGGTCFFLHALVTRTLTARPRHALIFCLFGAVAIGFQFSLMQITIRESGAALAAVLLYSMPVWVAIFSRFLFGERIPRARLAALAFAMLGVAMISLSGGSLVGKPASPLGIGLGLLTGVIFAATFVFLVFWKDRYGTVTIYTYLLFSGACALLPFLSISLEKSATAWFSLLTMGAVTCYGAYFAYGQSLRFISPVKAAILCNLEPVVGTILCWLWWDENFSPLGWAGCAVVIGAVILLTLRREREPAG